MLFRSPSYDPAEKATALRKLLEAKDAAVRCLLPVLLAVVALACLLAPSLAFAQEAAAPPAADPILVGLGELVQHAKLGRTVLAILAGVVVVVRLVLRFGRLIPGAVGAWLGSSTAAWVLPGVIGVIGGVSTTVAKGGAWYDGLIGGILVAVGAWLPVPQAPPPTPSPAADAAAAGVTASSDAAAVFRGKGPQP